MLNEHLMTEKEVCTIKLSWAVSSVDHYWTSWPHGIDYCNSLYYGDDAQALKRLQKIQNAAAKVINSTKKYDSVTPLLFSLKWLRIIYKILVLVVKLAPVYLSGLVSIYIPTRSLRSENEQFLWRIKTKYKHKGDRAFLEQPLNCGITLRCVWGWAGMGE